MICYIIYDFLMSLTNLNHMICYIFYHFLITWTNPKKNISHYMLYTTPSNSFQLSYFLICAVHFNCPKSILEHNFWTNCPYIIHVITKTSLFFFTRLHYLTPNTHYITWVYYSRWSFHFLSIRTQPK